MAAAVSGQFTRKVLGSLGSFFLQRTERLVQNGLKRLTEVAFRLSRIFLAGSAKIVQSDLGGLFALSFQFFFRSIELFTYGALELFFKTHVGFFDSRR